MIVVSVIVVTFNHVQYIKQCLQSILRQQVNFKLELIIGEDGSQDGTREICEGFKAEFPDIVVLRLQNRANVIYIDGKPTGRFNLIDCLSIATGKYIAFCEGDDYWNDDNKLQQQVDFLEANQDYSLCFHGATKLNQATQRFDPFHLKKPKEVTDLTDLLRGENYIPTASILLRRDLVSLPEFFKELPFADYFLHLMCARKGHKIKFIDKEMAVYRIHSGGVHSVLLNSKKNLITAHKKHILFWSIMLENEYFNREELKVAFISNHKYMLHFAAEIGDIKTLRECFNSMENWESPLSFGGKLKLMLQAYFNKTRLQS